MYWRRSIPLLGGLKYNITSNGKDYVSYRKNGMYIKEPVADIKKDFKSIIHPEQKTLDVNEVAKKITESFDTYNDGEILNQVELLKQFKLSNDVIVDVVKSAIFDGSPLTIDRLNHARGVFSQIKCSKSKKKEINQFIDNKVNQVSGQSAIPSVSGNQQQLPSIPVIPINENRTSGTQSSQNTPTRSPANVQQKVFEITVDIFREDNGQYNKVSIGKCKVENKQVIISANVSKSFEIKDIAEMYKKSGNLFIFLKTRKQPFILKSNDIDDLVSVIEQLNYGYIDRIIHNGDWQRKAAETLNGYNFDISWK